MNIQTKASFKKEYLAFFRTRKFMGLALGLIGLSVFNPLLLVGMSTLMEALSDVYDNFGVDISGLTSALGSSVSTGVSQAIMDLAQTGLIIFLLVIISNAGGEQKKRSIMIPRSSGLRSFSYIFPKFIIYPLTAFVLAVVASLASWGVSVVVFTHNDVTLGGVLLGGMLTGVCMMFYVCSHLTIGTATGKAGMSAAVCIVASLLLPSFFTILGSEIAYNPFTLNVLAGSIVYSQGISTSQTLEIIMTVVIAIVIMAILYYLALFAQNAKKIDNSGDEIRI